MNTAFQKPHPKSQMHNLKTADLLVALRPKPLFLISEYALDPNLLVALSPNLWKPHPKP